MMEGAVVRNLKVCWIVVFIYMSWTTFPTCTAQTTVAQFDVVVAGFTIGKVNAEEIITGEKTQYKIISKVGFWFFGKVDLGISLQNVFQNGMLIDSKSQSKTNRGSFYSYITWKENYYDVNSTTYKFENTQKIENPIFHTSASFYFDEPKDGDKMMSETYGLVSEVVQKSKGVYEVNINGNRNQYHYVNSKLDKINIQNPVKNFVVRRIR